MPERPTFLERALQGLAFWIGHRHSLFRHYPLPEGAMVAEACNLIQANLSDSLLLHPECQFSRLVPNGIKIDGIGKLARADLVIFSNKVKLYLKDTAHNNDLSNFVQFVMEVKRYSASKAMIDDDLKRLYSFLSVSQTNVRCFLIVVSESKSPSRFVKDGKSRLGSNDIPNCGGYFHVRRTVKAAASFSQKRSAHYVCLIEVFRSRAVTLPEI